MFFRSLDEVVLIPPPDTFPVIWNENVCKVFVKEKTPSPLLSLNRKQQQQLQLSRPPDDLDPREIDHSCNCAEVSTSGGGGGHERELLAGLNGLRAREDLTDVTLWAADARAGQMIPFHAHR